MKIKSKNIFETVKFDGLILEEFKNHSIIRKFKKNEIILNSGQVENYLSIITKGSIGMFALDSKGNEICLDLTFEGEFSVAFTSFTKRTPSEAFVKAFEDTELISVSYNDLNKLYESSIEGQRVGRESAEAVVFYLSRRIYNFVALSAEERFKLMLEENPDILLRIPQKHIASYLGITPEAFSRIKKIVL